MIDLDLKEKLLKRKYELIGAAVVLAVFGPAIYAILKALFIGTTALFGTAILLIVGVNFLPVLAMKMANWKLQALKAEARKNPIETAQNQLLQMSKQFDEYKAYAKQRIAAGEALVADVKELRKTNPEGAARFEDRIEAFEAEVGMHEARIAEMNANLTAAREKVEEITKIWNLEKKHAGFKTVNHEEQALSRIILNEALDEVMLVAQESASRLKVEAMVRRSDQNIAASRKASLSNQPPQPLLDVVDVKATLKDTVK